VALAQRVQDLTRELGPEPPRPPHWGGYRLQAARVEFWQGRPSRLHDRLAYTRNAAGDWDLTRLAP
jgi:pyridoxamine 5'-phosphate oxidase